jgi:hypothetical protein
MPKRKSTPRSSKSPMKTPKPKTPRRSKRSALNDQVKRTVDKLASESQSHPSQILDAASMTVLAIKLSSFSVIELKDFIAALKPGSTIVSSNVKSELVEEAQRLFMEKLDVHCSQNIDNVDVEKVSRHLKLKLVKGKECETLKSMLGPAGRIAIAMHSIKNKAHLASEMIKEKVYGSATALNRLKNNRVFKGLWTVITHIMEASVKLGSAAVKLIGSSLLKCVKEPAVCITSIVALYNYYCGTASRYDKNETLCDLIKTHACSIITTVLGTVAAGVAGTSVANLMCSMFNMKSQYVKVNGGSWLNVTAEQKAAFKRDAENPAMISQTEDMFQEYIETCDGDQVCIEEFSTQRTKYRNDPVRYMTGLI